MFHPGTQRGPYTARAYDQNGLLAWFATSIYYDPKVGHRLLRLLPGGMRKTLEAELLRRHLPGLDPRKVRCSEFWEWLTVGAARVPRLRGKMNDLIEHRNHVLGRRVGRWIARDVDVLYAVNSSALLAFREARRRGVLCMLDQTTPTLPIWREMVLGEQELAPPEWQPKGRLPYARHDDEEIEELELADLVLCGSEFCAESVRRVAKTRRPPQVVHYGVDVSRFAPVDRTGARDGFTILMVGNLQPEKGVWYLLRAAASLKIPGLRVKLVGHKNVGDTALAPYAHFVTHIPHVPRITVHEQYRDADVYVLPTLFEGASNTIYEAMASGLPVVTTPNSGSVIRDGVEGFLVPIRDPEAIAARIQQLYNDRDLRLQMGLAGRERVLQFTWENYGRNLAHVTSDLWAECRAAPVESRA